MPAPWLRDAVRSVLENAPAYTQLAAPERLALARAMVEISSTAAGLIAQEQEAQREIDHNTQALSPLSRAQETPPFGAATDRIASTTRNVLDAVSFPRFVTDLVNGVFRAMLDSSAQQMEMYVKLLRDVSSSAEGFERTQYSLAGVRQWVADRFPEQIEYDLPELEPGEEQDPEEVADIRLRLRGNASMPTAEEIRATLGMEPGEAIDASNPEQLLPLARRQIARQRQQMLATMVMMGMQRIVIDSGRINASMRFHIDTRSAANEDRGSQFGMQNRVRAGGSFGVGPWGASAEVENTVSYVSSQRSQTTEEINTDLTLNSSVELNFRTDYLPLNQMAAQAQADRIRSTSLNPASETDTANERRDRQAAQRLAEESRRSGLLTMPSTPSSTAAAPVTRPTTPAVAPVAPAVTSSTTGSGTPPGTPSPTVVAPVTRPTTPAVTPVAPAVTSSATGSGTPNVAGSVIGGTIGSAVGGAAGTVAGGAVGGAIGGAIGSAVLPVAGTAVGTAVGSQIGSVLGPTLGSVVGGMAGSAIGGAVSGGA